MSRFSSIPCALRRVAIVAFAARIGGASFIEILQEDFAATRVSICKVTHATELVEEEVFLIFGFVIEKPSKQGEVGTFVKQHSLAFLAIASGSPRLLVIAFHVFGQVEVHHKPYIGFVDAHAKSNGGHNDLDVVMLEGTLSFLSLLGG